MHTSSRATRSGPVMGSCIAMMFSSVKRITDYFDVMGRLADLFISSYVG